MGDYAPNCKCRRSKVYLHGVWLNDNVLEQNYCRKLLLYNIEHILCAEGVLIHHFVQPANTYICTRLQAYNYRRDYTHDR